MTQEKLVRNAVRCLKCGDVVESKHRHDFQICSCRSVFTDGGTDYIRRGGDINEMELLDEFEEEPI